MGFIFDKYDPQFNDMFVDVTALNEQLHGYLGDKHKSWNTVIRKQVSDRQIVESSIFFTNHLKNVFKLFVKKNCNGKLKNSTKFFFTVFKTPSNFKHFPSVATKNLTHRKLGHVCRER